VNQITSAFPASTGCRAQARFAQTVPVNCVRCLRSVEPGARWCSFCGEPVPAIPGSTQPLPDPLASEDPAPSAALPASGAAIAALVFAITGLAGPLPLLGSLLALGFARRARREAAYGMAAGWEIARAARIIAWTSIVFLLIAAAVVAGVIAVEVQQGHHYYFRIGG